MCHFAGRQHQVTHNKMATPVILLASIKEFRAFNFLKNIIVYLGHSNYLGIGSTLDRLEEAVHQEIPKYVCSRVMFPAAP